MSEINELINPLARQSITSTNMVDFSLLTQHPLFSECKRDDIARLLPKLSVISLQQGQTLFNSRSECDALYLVIQGSLQTAEGWRANDGHFTGEESLLNMPNYVSTVYAAQPSVAIRIPIEALKFLYRSEQVLTFLTHSFHSRIEHKPAPDWESPSCEKPIETPIDRLVGWALVSISPFIVYYLLSVTGQPLSHDAKYFAAILTTTATMWVFKLLPDYIPALFAVLSAVLLGVVPSEVAFQGFASNSFFMAMSILGLSAVIRASGLSYRALLYLIRLAPNSTLWYNISFFAVGGMLTPIVPTVNGRVVMVAPLLRDVLSGLPKRCAAQHAPRLKANLFFGVSLLSPLFISSKSINFMIFGMLPMQQQAYFQWFDWFLAASVVGGVLLIFYTMACSLLFQSSEPIELSRTLINTQLKTLGPLSSTEWSGVIGIVVLIVSLLLATSHGIDIAWVALTILFYLLVFGFLQPRQFRSKIDWSFLVFLGALIGMIMTLEYVGLDHWLISQLSWLANIMRDDFALFILLLAAVVGLVRVILPINASVVILATLLMPAASQAGVNPWVVGFMVLLFAETSFLAYQASYYVQFLQISGEHSRFEHLKMLQLNGLIYLFKIVAIYLSLPYWASMGLLS